MEIYFKIKPICLAFFEKMVSTGETHSLHPYTLYASHHLWQTPHPTDLLITSSYPAVVKVSIIMN